MRRMLFICLLTACSLGHALAREPATALLLTGARVLDPAGEGWLDGRQVIIREGRIQRLLPARQKASLPDVRRLDLHGLYLVPGLIDLHTHLLLHPYDEAAWNDQVLKESLESRTLRASVAARASLEAGFTTLRDLGTEGAAYADVALRDAIAAGLIPGPRLFVSTRAIVATGCYGPAGYDPRWSLPRGAQEATGPDEMRRVVRQQVAAGADWIKLYADYRRRPGDPATPTFSLQELKAAVDEARSAGLPVAAHAATAAGIRRAVLAGVDTIEHGTGATADLLDLMRQKDVVLCPTLAASEAMSRYGGWQPGEPEPARLQADRKMFSLALQSGVTVACGSDAGVFSHGDNVREIELMVAYGMTPQQALRAATAAAARVLGRGEDLGRVSPGFVADLVAVEKNPLKDPAALRRPIMVLAAGRVVLDKR